MFKRSQRGLYDGAVLQSGNNLPKSRHKTKRTWAPNVQKTKMNSEILNKMVQLRLTTRAMRTVKKLGGLDRYLVGTRDDKLGKFGRDLRGKLADKVVRDEIKRERSFISQSSKEDKKVVEMIQNEISQSTGTNQTSL